MTHEERLSLRRGDRVIYKATNGTSKEYKVFREPFQSGLKNTGHRWFLLLEGFIGPCSLDRVQRLVSRAKEGPV